MEGMGRETGGSSLAIQRHEEEAAGLYKAAFEGDLQAVIDILGKEVAMASGFEWEMNPLRGLIEGRGRPRVAVVLLTHYGPEALLLQARCAATGNTLLHHAALFKKEKLAIILIDSLPSSDNTSFKRQCFLEAINHSGRTVLHIATDNLLSTLVAELLKEKNLKVNIKDTNGETVLDLIRKKCYMCKIRDDWKTPWRISISLRATSAKLSRNLKKFEDEEDVIKKHSAIQMLFMNDEAWNITINIIVVVATLAFALVFAAIFTVPQTVALGGDNKASKSSIQMTSSNTKGGSNSMEETDSNTNRLRDSLQHNAPFKAFVWSSTVACIFMIYVLVALLPTITSNYSTRALMFLFSWLSFAIMAISLILAYVVALYMYMGSYYIYILLGCVAGIVAIAITLALYFGILKSFGKNLQSILRITLLHGLVVTFLLGFLPTNVVVQVEKILFSIDT